MAQTKKKTTKKIVKKTVKKPKTTTRPQPRVETVVDIEIRYDDPVFLGGVECYERPGFFKRAWNVVKSNKFLFGTMIVLGSIALWMLVML
jgi:hypothetical protein